ncbi:MAG TPA: type II 3-dehydroquinate dehydratase [Actinomycetota bacterium]|nr:type II 3-dehydroquinate dehydratase [Actinomycetota bacterium]
MGDATRILLLNGPNLGGLGRRKTDVYGVKTLADVEAEVRAEISPGGWELVSEQREGEGELIHVLQEHRDVAGAIVNPGALMIAGWSLRDALEDFPPPWVEVHISNVWAREEFRHSSVLSPIASGVVAGFGTLGYRLAARALVEIVDAAPTDAPG